MSAKDLSVDTANMARSLIYYAIGDVHGECERLKRLHAAIHARHEKMHAQSDYRIVHLGDYVDRGPDSAGAVAFLMNCQAADPDRIICLRGNHEQMMIEAHDPDDSSARDMWLRNGGQETLDSYETMGLDAVPQPHLDWLESLPDIYVEDDQNLIFVHAGVDTRDYPNCRPGRRLWTRASTFFKTENWDNPELYAHTVIHGHTPTDDFFPDVHGETSRRINVDTGAVYGGRLTAVCLTGRGKPSFIYA